MRRATVAVTRPSNRSTRRASAAARALPAPPAREARATASAAPTTTPVSSTVIVVVGLLGVAARGQRAEVAERAGDDRRLGARPRGRVGARGRAEDGGGDEQAEGEEGGAHRLPVWQTASAPVLAGRPASIRRMEAATAALSGDKAQRIVDAMRASVAARGAAGSTFDHVAREAGRLARAAALLLRHQGAAAGRGRAARLGPAPGRARRGDRRRAHRRRPAARARALARGPRRARPVVRGAALRAVHLRAPHAGDRRRAGGAAPPHPRARRRAARGQARARA